MLNFRFLLQVVLHFVIVFVVFGSGLSCHGGNSVVPPIPKPPVYPRIDDSPAWSPDGERDPTNITLKTLSECEML